MNFKLVIANWKMNPASLDEAERLAKKIKTKISKSKKTKIFLCPSALHLSALKKIFSKTKVLLGGQNFFLEQKGSWTGRLSAEMFKKTGADFMIIGHSEVRALGETDEEVNLKIKEALKNKLMVVLCIGENQRDDEGSFYLKIEEQIRLALNGLNNKVVKNIIVAYEPVWAIGENAKSVIRNEDLQAMIIFIRKTLADRFGIKNFNSIPVLYGGSVNNRNIGNLLLSGADGFLVGRDSLKIEHFEKIIKIIENN